MKFAVVTNKSRDCDLSVTEKIIHCLSEYGAECAICSTADALNKVSTDCNAIITVGGDGTILGISRVAAQSGCPVVGVNKGNLGYLAELEPDGISELKRLVSGDYYIENRMMLRSTVSLSDEEKEFYALNDVVVTHDAVLRITDFDLSCDGYPVAHYRADGLIFSTPTGSTAYSLSAGGPIVDPAHRAMILTPICAHTLNSRPILFRDDAVLSVHCSSRDEGLVRLYADGGEGYCLPNASTVRIMRSPFPLKLIRFSTNSFYNILSKKIH